MRTRSEKSHSRLEMVPGKRLTEALGCFGFGEDNIGSFLLSYFAVHEVEIRWILLSS